MHPGVKIFGQTKIQKNVLIESGAILKDCIVEEGAQIFGVDRDLDRMKETIDRVKEVGGTIETGAPLRLGSRSRHGTAASWPHAPPPAWQLARVLTAARECERSPAYQAELSAEVDALAASPEYTYSRRTYAQGGGALSTYAAFAAFVGAPRVAGSTAVSGGVYTLKGSGSDIFGTADGFHYALTQLTGDGEIRACAVRDARRADFRHHAA